MEYHDGDRAGRSQKSTSSLILYGQTIKHRPLLTFLSILEHEKHRKGEQTVALLFTNGIGRKHPDRMTHGLDGASRGAFELRDSWILRKP